MAKLVYSMLMSLDGYVEDAQGRFEWAAPDEELHAYVNELAAPVGTYLYGRRMYEMMVYWETAHTLPDQSEIELEWARQWQATEKIVYSTSLSEAQSARTTIVREFDADAVRRLKTEAKQDLAVAGPALAAQALHAGLVDELQLIVFPVVVGGGKRFLPEGVHLDLEQLEDRRFSSGAVLLRYGVRRRVLRSLPVESARDDTDVDVSSFPPAASSLHRVVLPCAGPPRADGGAEELV